MPPAANPKHFPTSQITLLQDRGQARSSLQKPPGALGDPFTPNQGSPPWPEGFVRSHRSSARQFPAPNLQVELKAPSGVRCALRGGRASERTQSSVDGESKPRGCFGARGVGGGGQRGGSGGGCSSFDARQLRAALGLHLACPGSKAVRGLRGGCGRSEGADFCRTNFSSLPDRRGTPRCPPPWP